MTLARPPPRLGRRGLSMQKTRSSNLAQPMRCGRARVGSSGSHSARAATLVVGCARAGGSCDTPHPQLRVGRKYPVLWPPIGAGGPAAPVEHERDWLARIKAVRCGDQPRDATGTTAPRAGDERVRVSKRRKR